MSTKTILTIVVVAFLAIVGIFAINAKFKSAKFENNLEMRIKGMETVAAR